MTNLRSIDETKANDVDTMSLHAALGEDINYGRGNKE